MSDDIGVCCVLRIFPLKRFDILHPSALSYYIFLVFFLNYFWSCSLFSLCFHFKVPACCRLCSSASIHAFYFFFISLHSLLGLGSFLERRTGLNSDGWARKTRCVVRCMWAVVSVTKCKYWHRCRCLQMGWFCLVMYADKGGGRNYWFC